MLIDQNGKFIRIDNEYSKVMGYSQEQLLNMCLGDLSAANSKINVREKIKSAIERGNEKFYHEQITRDGRAVVFQVCMQFIPETGNIVLLMDDTTDRRENEERLASALQHLKFHVENTPLATVEFSSRYEVISWSSKAEEMFGWSREEILGKTIPEIKWVYQEDIERVSKLSEEMFSGKKTSNIQINRNYRKDGSVITCAWYNSALVDDSGKLHSVYSIIQDITGQKKNEEEMKKNEEKFHSIFTQSPFAIELYDSEGKLIDINQSGIDMFGIIDPEEVPGFGLFSDPNLPPEAIGKLLNGKLVDFEFEFDFDLVKKNNFYKTYKQGKCFLQCMITPWKSAQGFPSGYILHLLDITDRKLAEMQLEKNTEKMKIINETKDKFYSIIAHDLRSPFQGILSCTNILLEEGNDLSEEEKFTFLKKLDDISKNTYNLLENLLDWSRMQTGKIPFYPAGLNLLEECNSTLALLEQIALNKGIHFDNRIDGGISVYADKYMLQMIIRNLITNGIKYSYGGGTITLNAVEQENFVTVSFADNGVGINAENMDKIFNVGKSISTRGTAEEKGSGLGLLLCKEMVEKNGGRIWLESKENTGTTFFINLPSFSDKQSSPG